MSIRSLHSLYQSPERSQNPTKIEKRSKWGAGQNKLQLWNLKGKYLRHNNKRANTTERMEEYHDRRHFSSIVRHGLIKWWTGKWQHFIIRTMHHKGNALVYLNWLQCDLESLCDRVVCIFEEGVNVNIYVNAMSLYNELILSSKTAISMNTHCKI